MGKAGNFITEAKPNEKKVKSKGDFQSPVNMVVQKYTGNPMFLSPKKRKYFVKHFFSTAHSILDFLYHFIAREFFVLIASKCRM